MKGINRTLKSGVIASLVAMAPTMAMASGEGHTINADFHALSGLDQSDLIALDVMSENDLAQVQGEFFNFGINIAIAPQFNICIFCNGVNQTNLAMLFGNNNFR